MRLEQPSGFCPLAVTPMQKPAKQSRSYLCPDADQVGGLRRVWMQ